MASRSRIRRVATRVVYSLGGLLLALLALLALLLGTQAGRNFALARALPYANDAIPGRLEVADFAELGSQGLELRDVSVYDPENQRVLHLSSLRVEADLLALRPSDLRLRKIRLGPGEVDLSQVTAKRRGLVAAFVDPDAPPSPPSTEPTPYVLVGAIEIDDFSAKLPSDLRLATSVRKFRLRAAFELDQTPRAQVHSMTAEVMRQSGTIARVDAFSGLLGRAEEPSRAKLLADLAGAKLALSLSAVAPPAKSWQTAPLDASIGLAEVTAPRLAHLTKQDALERAFMGSLSLNVTISGSVNALQSTWNVSTNAGNVHLGASLADRGKLGFVLDTREFRPAQLVAGAPEHVLSANLSGNVDLSKAPGSIGVDELILTNASIDREALPSVRARTRVTRDKLEQLDVTLRDEHSLVHIAGQAGFDGSAALDVSAHVKAPTVRRLALLAGEQRPAGGDVDADLNVRRIKNGEIAAAGDISARKLEFADLSLGALDVKLDLSGQPPDLSGSVDVDVRDLTRGDVRIHAARLGVRGGPEQYALNLKGRSNQGDLKLAADVRRGRSEVEIQATASGTRQGHTVDLKVAETRVSMKGDLRTEGIELSFAEQALTLRGALSRDAAALQVEAEAVDLASLNRLLPKTTQLKGRASVHAELQGRLTRPSVSLRIEGDDLGLADKPGVDLELSGILDSQQGRAELDFELNDANQGPQKEHLLDASLDAESRFSTELALAEALEHAEHQVHLDLKTFDLEFLKQMVPDANVPVEGRLAADLTLNGSVTAPQVGFELEGELKPAWSKRTLRVSHQLDLTESSLRADLRVADAKGEWVDVTVLTTLPPLTELTQEPTLLAQRQRWRVAADINERELSELPIPVEHREALPPAWFSGSLTVAHEPEQEPELELALILRQSKAVEAAPGCVAKGLRLDTDLSLSGGELRLAALGRQAERELLKVDASAKVRVAPALSGQQPEIGKITAELRSSDLELRQIPFVCERFGGRVNLVAHLDDPLGAEPDVALKLRIANLSAGSHTSVDTEVSVFVKPDQAGVDANVRHGVNRSTFAARVQVKLGDGHLTVDEKAQLRGKLELRHLPIEPFLDPKGAISYATGTLSGSANLKGTLKKPQASGTIELEQLGFTATDVAQPLRNIKGRIKFTESRVAVEEFEAHDRDGTLRLDGAIDLANTKKIRGDFRVRAQEFPLRQQGQVVATTNIDARIRSTLTPRKNQVRVILREVDTWLENAAIRRGIALRGHRDIVVDGVPALPSAQRQPPEQTAVDDAHRAPKSADENLPEPAAPPRAKSGEKVTEIVLDAKDKFWVKRDDFAVKLAALLNARIEGDSVRVEGDVTIDRGYLQLFGKVFEIERGSNLDFIGSPEPDPVLSIDAVHDNRRSGQSVKVRITGRGSAPELNFFVDDVAVTAGDAFVALFGAQRSNEDPKAAGDQARSFVGGLTAGVLATAARRELGAAAPILMVDPGEDGGSATVRAGFELDSIVPKFLRPIVTGMYFEGIVDNEQDTSTQDANVNGGALLEIYFPRDFFTTGQYGPGSTWSVDLGWQL